MHIVNTIHHTLDYVGGVFLDKVTGKCYTYTYDTYENVTEEKVDGVAFKSYEYDEHNRLEKTTVSVGNGTHVYRPIYDTRADGKIYADNAVVGVTLDGKFTARAEHDNLGRVTRKSIKLNGAESALIAEELTYLTTADGTNTRLTNMVESFTNKVNGTAVDSLSYVYDNNGNITEIKRDGEVIIQYAYDGLNQLVREDNAILGKITTFSYDTAGNITEKKVYNRTTLGVGTLEQTIPYTYAATGWKDRLVSYNGQAITYDALGNPTSYRGHTLVWGKVKQLQAYDTNSFTYNAEGIRTSKNNITYELDGTKILREVRPDGVIEYYYGNNGIVGFKYNNVEYYYQKNQQGDIVSVYDHNGVKKAEYTYDAWGKCTVVLDTEGIGTFNPFRYRSYYFDIETGLYYLQTRYYDPEVGRFINADGLISTGQGILGYNMFAYCLNNPIMYFDPEGQIGIASILLLICAAGACLIVPSSESQLPSSESHQSSINPRPSNFSPAIEAAYRAEIVVRYVYGKPYTIDINIDTEDVINSVDYENRDYFYIALFVRMMEKAKKYGVPQENLMSLFHIRWEFEAHVLAYYCGLEAADETNLNFEETPGSMIKRALQ